MPGYAREPNTSSSVGAGSLYQPSAPTSPVPGQIWIDSDDTVATVDANNYLSKVDGSAIYATKISPSFSGSASFNGLANFTNAFVSFNSASVSGIDGAKGGGTDKVFYENDAIITANYTISNGKNAMSAGPITINNGVLITIPSGSVWTVI